MLIKQVEDKKQSNHDRMFNNKMNKECQLQKKKKKLCMRSHVEGFCFWATMHKETMLECFILMHPMWFQFPKLLNLHVLFFPKCHQKFYKNYSLFQDVLTRTLYKIWNHSMIAVGNGRRSRGFEGENQNMRFPREVKVSS